MKNRYPKVSIITVNFNGKRHLEIFFASLSKLRYPRSKLEIIFVDNASEDGSVDFVKSRYPKVKIIQNNCNNYCKAVNLGIRASRSGYIALLNNDTKLDRGWLVHLTRVIAKDRKIAAAGGKILSWSGKLQNASHYELPNFYWGERGAGKDSNAYNNIEEVPSLCAAAILYRKEAVSRAGFFDEDFVIYGEDVDMSFMLRQHGYRLIFVPESVVYHRFHGTATEELARYYIERNRLLFLAKHCPGKLSSSLTGSGYFTAERSISSCGKIYSLFPDIIMKLIKSQPIDVAREAISGLFQEINKIVNYENNILEKALRENEEEKNKVISSLKDEIQHVNSIVEQEEKRAASLKWEIQQSVSALEGVEKELAQKAEEVLSKDGQLIERRAETDALRDELSRLAEDLAARMVELEENHAQLIEKDKNAKEIELESNSYKEELGIVLNHLRQRMDEVLIKDSQIIEKDAQIGQLRIEKEQQIDQLRRELDGIYNSEGFRLILRPFWTTIWNARKGIKAMKIRLGKAVWFAVTLTLVPLFVFLAASFVFEYAAWLMLRPLLKSILSRKKRIRNNTVEKFKISVVIPNYNGAELLKECLSSLFAADGFRDGESEVLVVDDASRDGSVNYIKEYFPRVRLLVNKTNRGFGFTCNRGIKAAANEIVVLLNNDIILTKDFLKPLLRHFKRQDVFAVTPKLYAWDRKTFAWGMHMGSFKDGYIKLWNESETGNGDRLRQPAPSVFAIGGAMVFRKADFVWMGGFDNIYRPNCWEDIDIGYRAWKRGLKVIYEPDSIMYHKGRATLTYERPKEIKNELLFTWKNITDAGILKEHLNLLPWHLYINRMNFLKGFLWALDHLPQTLWHRILERSLIACPQDRKIFNSITSYYNNFINRGGKYLDESKPTVLLVSRFLPYPLNTGGKIRINNLVKLLSEKYNFILLSLIDHKDELAYIPEIKGLFSEVHTVLAKSPLDLNFPSRLFYPELYKLAYSYSRELAEKLKELEEAKAIDIIHIETNELLYLVDYVKFAPIVYTEHDISILSLHKSYYKNKVNLLKSFVDHLKKVNFHSRQIKKIDRVITLSREDDGAFRGFFPKSPVTLIPTAVDLKHFSCRRNAEKTDKLIFVGHYLHYPNEDAVVYFSKKIFPLIKKRVPSAQFLIVGSNPTPAVEALAKKEGIKLIGAVPDVKPYLEEAAVFVNAIRISAGIKGKVLEAMASGVPVVSTRSGASGIDAEPGKDILLAERPREFAEKVIRLLNDASLRERLIINAKRLVSDKYDWHKSADKLDGVYRGLSFFQKNASSGNIREATEEIVNYTNSFIDQKIAQTEGDLGMVSDGPEELHIELTYNCNSKCIMCDLWDYDKRVPSCKGRELSLEEIKRFVEESRLLQKTKTVVLSGGEPFMRNDIVEICGFFSRHFPDSSIGILTNGMATDAIVAKSREVLSRFSPKSLWLGSSLDGIGNSHDKIRGAEGAFSRLYQTINRCKKELPGVDLSLTFTLTPHNIDQLMPAKKFADNEGANFFAQFVVPKTSRQEFNWSPQELGLAEKEIGRIIEGLADKIDRNAFYGVEGINDKALMAQLYFWSHLVKYQINPQRFFKKCVAGYRFAMLNPYGDLFFCPTHKDNSVGNVRENKFDYLWTCDKAEQLRRFISSGNCHCWLVCILFPVLEKILNN